MPPFVVDRGALPCLPLSAPHADSEDHAAHDSPPDSPGPYALRMRSTEATVRELLATTQAASQAKPDAGRVNTVFQVGDRMLLRTNKPLDAADIGKLRPRRDGPSTATAGPSPSAHTLALPREMPVRCSPGDS